MSKINPEFGNPSDESVVSDLTLRQEPDEEEDEEQDQDEDDGTNEDDDDGPDNDGYSE